MEGEIINAIQSNSSSSDKFDYLSKKLVGYMMHHIIPFTRDKNVMRIEDTSSLLNICLLKLDLAIKNFVYDEKLSKNHNERKFLKCFGEYMYNALVDIAHKLNKIKKRVPGNSSKLVSLDNIVNDDDISYDVEDQNCCSAIDMMIYEELRCEIKFKLTDQENIIFDFLCIGLTPEEISRKIGIYTSSVRYIVSKIQKKLRNLSILQ